MRSDDNIFVEPHFQKNVTVHCRNPEKQCLALVQSIIDHDEPTTAYDEPTTAVYDEPTTAAYNEPAT